MLLGRWWDEGADDEVQLGEDEEDEQDLLHPCHPLHPHDGQGQDADQADTPDQANIMNPMEGDEVGEGQDLMLLMMPLKSGANW